MHRPTTTPFVAIACGGTGGHLFPGLAVAEELIRRDCEVMLLISPKEVDQQAVRSAFGMEVVTLPVVFKSKLPVRAKKSMNVLLASVMVTSLPVMRIMPKLLTPPPVLRSTSPVAAFALIVSRAVTVSAPAVRVTLPVGVVGVPNVRLPTLLVPTSVPPVLSVIVTRPPASRSSPKKLAALLSVMTWLLTLAASCAVKVVMPPAVTTPVVDVGRVPVGEITTGTVEVISLTGSEEQVAYISMKCQCAEFDLPATLPPERATPIGFRLRAPNEPGAFRRPAVVKSSAGDVRFEMVGVAVASQ